MSASRFVLMTFIFKLISAQHLPIITETIIGPLSSQEKCPCKELSSAIQNSILNQFTSSAMKQPLFGRIIGPLLQDITSAVNTCPYLTAIQISPEGYTRRSLPQHVLKDIIGTPCACGSKVVEVNGQLKMIPPCSCKDTSGPDLGTNGTCTCNSADCTCGIKKSCSCGNVPCKCGQSVQVCNCGSSCKCGNSQSCNCNSRPCICTTDANGVTTCTCGSFPCNCGSNQSCKCGLRPCICVPSVQSCNCGTTPCTCGKRVQSCNCGTTSCRCGSNLACDCGNSPCTCGKSVQSCNCGTTPCICNSLQSCNCGKTPCACGSLSSIPRAIEIIVTKTPTCPAISARDRFFYNIFKAQ